VSEVARLPGSRWLPAARVLWVLLVLVNVGWFLANLPVDYRELLVPCVGAQCDFASLATQEVTILNELGVSIESYAAFQVGTTAGVGAVMFALGLLIFLRRSQDRIGLLASLALALFGLSGDWPLAEQSATLAALAWLLDSLAIVSIVLLFYLFPDGRAVPGWTRYAVALVIGTMVVTLLPIALLPTFQERLESGGGDLVIVGFMAAALVAQAQRYRRHSDAVQRQQTKWVLFGLAGTVLGYLLWVLTFVILPIERGAPRLYWNVFGLTGLALLLTALPITLAISILRYRLFDIDIVIKRTLVYGAVTASVLGLYFGSVVALQAAFRAVAGQESPLAIVASTLTIAALFNPLRRRFQTTVDRRFYRADYDAALALKTFSESVRDEVDIERIQEALIGLAQETMQPESVSLWLREPTTP